MKVDLKEGGSTFFELRRSVRKTERLCLAQMLVSSPRIQLQAEKADEGGTLLGGVPFNDYNIALCHWTRFQPVVEQAAIAKEQILRRQQPATVTAIPQSL
jgi:hypothetical protein